MSIEERVLNRIGELIEEGKQLSIADEFDQVRDEAHLHACHGWLAASTNVVQLAIPNPESAYRKSCEKIAGAEMGYGIPRSVGQVTTILANLMKDAQAGLLASIADQVRAEVFDDFLDHAKAYLDANYKNEAGVIAGVVVEDSIRRVCRKHGLSERGVKLDSLISALAKAGVLSGTKAKRARVSADVRTKATHAQWKEFDESDVKTTISFAEEFILAHLE